MPPPSSYWCNRPFFYLASDALPLFLHRSLLDFVFGIYNIFTIDLCLLLVLGRGGSKPRSQIVIRYNLVRF
jgi:hypothetical protein